MDAYTGFAAVYDMFMDNIPYGEWCDYLTGLLREDIQLLSADVTPAAQVVDRTSDSVSNWVIDYRRAKMPEVEFPQIHDINLS